MLCEKCGATGEVLKNDSSYSAIIRFQDDKSLFIGLFYTEGECHSAIKKYFYKHECIFKKHIKIKIFLAICEEDINNFIKSVEFVDIKFSNNKVVVIYKG